VLIAVVVLLFFALRGCIGGGNPSRFDLPKPTDTVRVNRKAVIKPIPKAEHWPVGIVTIYERDTVRRAQAEKEDILLSVKVRQGLTEVTTIDPKGEVKLLGIPTPDIASIVTVDASGAVKVEEDKKKTGGKFWKGLGTGLKFAGAIGLGIIVGKSL